MEYGRFFHFYNQKIGGSIPTLTTQKTGELTAGGVAVHLRKAPYPLAPRAL